MEYEGKNKSPYYGVWQSALLMIAAPVAMYFFFKIPFVTYSKMSKEEIHYCSLAFGCGVAFLFQFSCVIAGLFKGTLKVVINRLKEFFGNLSISVKFAYKYYFENIKEEGVVFWIFFVIITTTLGVTLFGIFSYISIM